MSINVVLWPLLAAWRGPLPAPQRAGEPQMSIKMTVSLLQKCNSDAARLAKMLSKDQLKSECEARSLRVTGTKSELAPRLLVALQAEAELGNAPPTATLPPPPADAPPRRTAVPLPRRPPPRAPPAPVESPPPLAPPPPAAEAAPFTQSGAGNPADSLEMWESSSTGSDLELTVLGSGACNPSPTRGASCLALRVRDGYWLFDVGEGTQVQLQRCCVRPGKIDRIFVTHAHGDHCFGLPGLLCLIARGREQGAPPVQICGPHGIRAFLRVALSFTGTRMLPRYVVHELHDIPDLNRRNPSTPLLMAKCAPPERETEWGEQPGGRDIPPSETAQLDGSWWTLDEGTADGALSVKAAPLRHTVPCVGYAVAESSKPGRLQPELVMPHVMRNADAIRAEWGVRDPRSLLKRVAALGPSERLVLPDGHALVGSEVLGEARKGRKVVVLGDCSDCSLATPIAYGADLLCHEATNAYLPRWGDTGGFGRHERDTISHGHSTPQMAGRAARAVGARALLLTHFSQRYLPHVTPMIDQIREMAAGEAGLPLERTHAAYDSLVVPIWQPDREKD